jgi:hypothetical protein
MRTKRKESAAENIVVVAEGEFSPPNLIRSGDDWVGIPVQWLHLVPNRQYLQRARIVLHLEYRQGDGDHDGDEQTEE